MHTVMVRTTKYQEWKIQIEKNDNDEIMDKYGIVTKACTFAGTKALLQIDMLEQVAFGNFRVIFHWYTLLLLTELTQIDHASCGYVPQFPFVNSSVCSNNQYDGK